MEADLKLQDKQGARLLELTQKQIDLTGILDKLNNAHIRYGAYAGSLVYLLTGYRPATDIDILIADDDIGKVKSLFPTATSVDRGQAVFTYLGVNKDVELLTHSDISAHAKLYPFRLTDLAWQNTFVINTPITTIRCLNPADTVLLKSIYRREGQGRHDLTDIKALIEVIRIDQQYLSARYKEVGGDEAVKETLAKYDLHI